MTRRVHARSREVKSINTGEHFHAGIGLYIFVVVLKNMRYSNV